MVRIRLRRQGLKRQPSYRVVVTDQRKARNGKYLENIGHYNPRTRPATETIEEDRALYWLSVGAQPSDAVRRLLEEGALSMGHGRAILGVDDPVKAADLARQAVAESWSVRETERRVRELASGGESPAREASDGAKARDPAIGVLEEALSDHLDARVGIQWRGRGNGAIRISFRGARELERVFAAVTGKEAAEIVG